MGYSGSNGTENRGHKVGQGQSGGEERGGSENYLVRGENNEKGVVEQTETMFGQVIAPVEQLRAFNLLQRVLSTINALKRSHRLIRFSLENLSSFPNYFSMGLTLWSVVGP